MRAPVQIIVNLKQGNVTRKGPSTLHDKQMRLLIPIDDNMHLFKQPGTYVHVSKSLVDWKDAHVLTEFMMLQALNRSVHMIMIPIYIIYTT